MLAEITSKPAAADNLLASLETSGAIGRITLRREPVNAFNDELTKALDLALDQAEAANLTVLLIGSSVRAFSAGADLKMVARRTGSEAGAAAMEATVRSMHRVFDRIASLDAVTVAEIGGVALGGGLELALACDLRIVAESALLGLPEPGVGLLPGAGGTQRLTRLCGAGLAARVILAGDKLNGPQAVAAGLAQWSVPVEELRAQSDALAARIASFSRMALVETKRCMALAAMPGGGGSQAEIAAIRKLMTNPDSAARVAAFAAR